MKRLIKKATFAVNLLTLSDEALEAVYQRAVTMRRFARPKPRPAEPPATRVRVDGRVWEILQRDAVVIGVDQDARLQLRKE